MHAAKTISLQMPSFSDLFSALSPEWQTRTLRERLLTAYRHELHCLVNVAVKPDCLEPQFVMLPWRQAEGEWICVFWVADATLPVTSASTWHGQNTSQWRHGGAIVILQGQVSTCYCAL